MKISIKTTLFVTAVCATAVWIGIDVTLKDDQSFLPVTEHAPLPVNDAPQLNESVTGLKGDYPKFLTTDDVLKGEVELPDQGVPDPAEVLDEKAEAWAKVDLAALQMETPDNLFWSMSAPTEDQAVLEHRKEVRDGLKEVERKMMARHATEEEIRGYYSYQQQLSEDYVEAITLILNRYGNVFPDEDFAGQNLARTLHLSKLQEIPAKMTRALEQREKFLAEKQEWLNDKAAYQAKLEAEAAEANRALGKI